MRQSDGISRILHSLVPPNFRHTWLVHEQRHLSDSQIAAHEAGHALAGHVLGERILEVQTYTGPQSALVRFEHAIHAEQVRLAGSIGELVAGFSVSPPDACSDMGGVDLTKPRAEPGAYTLLLRHLDAHRGLTVMVADGRQGREVIPGLVIHSYLEEVGIAFACEVTNGHG